MESEPEIRRLKMSDGIKLVVRQYQPANSPATRSLLWCHGVAEHGGRHEHVIREFVSRGWQVIIPDLRGHGLSEGIRVDVVDFERYLAHFDRIVEEYRLEPNHTALFGHSLGGLIMTRFVQTRAKPWAALVLSAPLLGVAVPIPEWKWWLGHLLSWVAPRTHLRTGIREDNLTRDPEFLAARHADPFIQNAVTVRWFFAMLAALKAAHKDAQKVRLPVLILQGLGDKTTDPKIPERWLATTASADTQFYADAKGLHELLKDTGLQSVCALVLEWLEVRVNARAETF
jgi:lysophospholipase